MARRLRKKAELRITEAELMVSGPERDEYDISAPDTIALVDVLQDGPELHSRIKGNVELLTAIWEGYKYNKVLASVEAHPTRFTMFRKHDGLIYTKSRAGVECICIPHVLFQE